MFLIYCFWLCIFNFKPFYIARHINTPFYSFSRLNLKIGTIQGYFSKWYSVHISKSTKKKQKQVQKVGSMSALVYLIY